MTVNEFMADFLVAGADYYRLDEAVHEYLEACDRLDSAAKNESIRVISDCIAKCAESNANAKASARDALAADLPNAQVYEDVTAAYGMVAVWDNRVSLLISMMRTIALETDADCIELLVRSRNNANAADVHRPGRTLDIADGIQLFSEVPDAEDESDEVDYDDDDATAEDAEGEIVDGIEEEDAVSEESTEVVGGWMPSDIPMNSTAVMDVDPVEDDSAEIFTVEAAETIADDGASIVEQVVDESPTEKPLSREEIQSIVLETMKEFFAQTAPVATQEEEKPKRTRRKSTVPKSPRRGLRRKKAEEETDGIQEAEE